MWRVLVVDDDEGTRDVFSGALRSDGFDVLIADCGHKAIDIAVRERPRLALVDVKLPDVSGFAVLAAIREACSDSSVIMMSAFADTRSVVEAMRLGARDFIEKPIDVDRVVTLVRKSAENEQTGLLPTFVARRLAESTVRIISSPSDFRTLSAWGRYLGISRGAIRNWCLTLGVRPKHALDFARLLRAVVRQNEECGPRELLDIVDTRTLRHMLQLGDNARMLICVLPKDVDDFLSVQQWVSNGAVLREIRRLVSDQANK